MIGLETVNQTWQQYRELSSVCQPIHWWLLVSDWFFVWDFCLISTFFLRLWCCIFCGTFSSVSGAIRWPYKPIAISVTGLFWEMTAGLCFWWYEVQLWDSSYWEPGLVHFSLWRRIANHAQLGALRAHVQWSRGDVSQGCGWWHSGRQQAIIWVRSEYLSCQTVIRLSQPGEIYPDCCRPPLWGGQTSYMWEQFKDGRKERTWGGGKEEKRYTVWGIWNCPSVTLNQGCPGVIGS